MKLSLFLAISLGFILIACSNDDDNKNGDIQIRSTQKTVKEFKMYVGSKDGAKEVKLKDKKPENYWSKEYLPEDWDSEKISFVGDSIIFNDLNKKYKYAFKKDSLFYTIVDGENKIEKHLGRGTKNHLEVNSSLIYHKNEESFRNKYDEFLDLEKSLKILSLPDTLTNEKDTVVWVNMLYTFR